MKKQISGQSKIKASFPSQVNPLVSSIQMAQMTLATDFPHIGETSIYQNS